MTFDLNAAKQAIENGMGEAQELIKDPSRIDALLVSLETALKDVPVAGDILLDGQELYHQRVYGGFPEGDHLTGQCLCISAQEEGSHSGQRPACGTGG